MTVCPSCATDLPDGARFCLQCGARVSDVAEAAPVHHDERKTVTSLFCDLVGFTAMSETADPEDVDALLREYAARARRLIVSHGGTVEKFIGDAVVGVFGVPAVHEDDPERAVRTALRLVTSLGDLAGPDGTPLQCRCGVNTGEAVVRPTVDAATGEGFLTGDAVNTAARLQAAAPPGGVAVGALTRALTERVIVYDPLPPVAAKGKRDPVAAWRAVGPVAHTGVDSGRQHVTPFVGRSAELASLRVRLEECVATSSVRFALLVGEPGIGKSRLVFELARLLEAAPELVTWRQGRCPAFGEEVTFAALGDVIREHAGVLESDDGEAIDEKLEAVLPAGEDRAWLRQRLRPLLGLEAPPASREESFAAWTRFVCTLAADGPAVLVLEDLHWAGEAMLAFVDYLLATNAGVPLLVLATARPELLDRHGGALAAGNGRQALVRVPALTEPEGAALIAGLLREDLPAETAGRILGLAGGNPLYAQQYASLLRDRGLLSVAGDGPELVTDDDLPVSDSVQAVLAARLDTLPPEQKALLCDAAVVGETFWGGALAALGGRDSGAVDAGLAALDARDLLRRAESSSVEGEAEYVFWHAVVRDVAYAQLTRPARLARHVKAAAWLETHAGQRVEETSGHYVAALELARATGDPRAEAFVGPAVRSLALAAERSAALDVAVAERQYAQALELVAPDSPERPGLLSGWAFALQQRGRFRESAEAFLEAADGLRRMGDVPAAAVALARAWGPLTDLGDDRSETVLADAEAMLADAPPSPQLVEVLAERAADHGVRGEWREAVACGDRTLALAAQLGLDVPARALGFRGLALCMLGDDAGLDDLHEALAAARRQGLGRDVAVLYSNLGMGLAVQHGMREVLDVHREGLAYARTHGIEEFVLNLRVEIVEGLTSTGGWDEALAEIAALGDELEGRDLAWMLLTLRDHEVFIRARRGDALVGALAEEQVARARESDLPDDVAESLFAAAEAAWAAGDGSRALDLLRECASLPGIAETSSYQWCVAEAVRVALAAGDAGLAARLADAEGAGGRLQQRGLTGARAALLEHDGRLGEAASGHAAAALHWREFGDPYEEAQALLGAGRCLAALGRTEEASAPLAAARERFAALGAAPALTTTTALLARLDR